MAVGIGGGLPNTAQAAAQAQLNQTRANAGAGQAGPAPATAPAHGPNEAANLSPAARQAAAYQRSNVAFDRFTGAFGRLSEAEKTELGGQIGARMKELTAGKTLTEAQTAELKWSTMAGVSADWAGARAAGQGVEGGAQGARNLGDLYYGSVDYMKNRQEYLAAGGQIGQ